MKYVYMIDELSKLAGPSPNYFTKYHHFTKELPIIKYIPWVTGGLGAVAGGLFARKRRQISETKRHKYFIKRLKSEVKHLEQRKDLAAKVVRGIAKAEIASTRWHKEHPKTMMGVNAALFGAMGGMVGAAINAQLARNAFGLSQAVKRGL